MVNPVPESLAVTLARNVEALVELATSSGRPIHRLPRGFSLRTLAHARDASHSLTLKSLQKLASAFGVEPWQLLVPDLSAELALNKRLAQTIRDYLTAHPAGKEAIEKVAASYRQTGLTRNP